MKPDCPRLARELQLLAAMNRTGTDAVKRRIADHQRWHRCPHDYDPGYLPREPEGPTP